MVSLGVPVVDHDLHQYCSSGSDALQLRFRRTVGLPQMTVGSACRRGKVCVQTSVGLELQKKVLENSMF